MWKRTTPRKATIEEGNDFIISIIGNQIIITEPYDYTSGEGAGDGQVVIVIQKVTIFCFLGFFFFTYLTTKIDVTKTHLTQCLTRVEII